MTCLLSTPWQNHTAPSARGQLKLRALLPRSQQIENHLNVPSSCHQTIKFVSLAFETQGLVNEDDRAFITLLNLELTIWQETTVRLIFSFSACLWISSASVQSPFVAHSRQQNHLQRLVIPDKSSPKFCNPEGSEVPLWKIATATLTYQ